MTEALGMIMDALIILLLAGTIFYAARLTYHIKAFRDSKAEMEKLLGNLSKQIDHAERAIEGLRENARQSGRDLQAVINEAQAMSEELQIMSNSGDKLAARLEQISDRGRAKMPKSKNIFPNADKFYQDDVREERPVAKKPAPAEKKDNSPFAGFAIRDPEFERGEAGDDMADDGLFADELEDFDAEGGFQSRAERELMEALQKKSNVNDDDDADDLARRIRAGGL